MVFEFPKAFDRVSHKLLTEKLFDTNIDMAIIKWIEYFLMDGQQCVVVDGSSSELLDVGCQCNPEGCKEQQGQTESTRQP